VPTASAVTVQLAVMLTIELVDGVHVMGIDALVPSL
jgi:ABC-type transporter Mla maintaining outer membrane lipid asymmetry permease subunit MlaE